MFEHSNWITNPTLERGTQRAENPAPLLRKSFTVDKPVKKATLAICGLGLAEYYLNGQKVTTDVLLPAYSRYDATTYYNTYDVTSLITSGTNAVAAILGNGMYNDTASTWDFEKANWRHFVKLICELTIEHQDGTTQSINSDPTWKVGESAILFSQARCGERYDARKETPRWADAGFDDSTWINAFICRSPGGELIEMNMPPIRIMETLPATIMLKTEKETVYDIGRNISGWARITLCGEAGREVTLRYAERLHEDGTIDQKNINEFNFDMPLRHSDEYIIAGHEKEVWEPRFVYHGFRYVSVENAPGDFTLEGRVVHTDLRVIGEFECGDDMLNRIHRAARYCTLYNYHGMPTDCPHREQNGWTGDASLSAEQFLMNLDMMDAYAKWLKDITDCQRPSGQIPGIAPTSGWGYNWGSGPAWDSALMLIPGYAYDSTGDDRLIRQCWPAMVKYMEYIRTMSFEHIVNFGLGDWVPPENAVICDVALTDTAYYYAFATAMARYANILGEDASGYESLRRDIRAAWREKFLVNDSILTEGQTAWATAIFQGLLDPHEVPAAAKRLAELVKQKDDHIDCGILGAKYIFTALAENGYQDVLYRMVTNPTRPSYAFWILSGMTTLCEDWELKASRNHHMFSEVEHWLYKYVAGIRIGEPGYKKVHIEPLFIDEVQWVKASHNDIRVEWNEDTVTVDTPNSGVLVMDGERIPLEPGVSTHPRKHK